MNEKKVYCITHVPSRGFCEVAIIGHVSLSCLDIDLGDGFATVFLDIAVVGGFKSTSVLGADGRKDLVGSLNGSSLLGLVLSSGVCPRVEEDKGVLLFGDSIKVPLGNGILQGCNTCAINRFCLGDSGRGDSPVSRCDRGKSGKARGCNSNLSEDNTTVDLCIQGSAGTLQNPKRKKVRTRLTLTARNS